MKIFSASQVRKLDTFTIKNEPVASIELMERAARVFTHWFVDKFSNEDRPICIFCGPGNNGGDGLAVARLLYERFYPVSLVICDIGSKKAGDFQANSKRLPESINAAKIILQKEDPFPEISHDCVIIDAIFGSGLSRPVEGYWGKLIRRINDTGNTIVSIDIPSGLFANQHSSGNIIRADYTLSFELPKLAFLVPENRLFVGDWSVKSIGLSPDFIKKEKTADFYITDNEVKPLLLPRNKFDHKGSYGHALLIMGSFGKMGAVILAAKACLRSGTGLVTVHIPDCGYEILQTSLPEVMVSVDKNEKNFSTAPAIKRYSAIGIGCGLDTKSISADALHKIITESKQPLLLDADALNLLAEHQDWLYKLPANSILTPHPGEFKRLFGVSGNDFEQNTLQRQKAKELGVIIILKGAHTCIADTLGNCYFNSTGNPGMATAGSGDVLSGIITGLLAQGYTTVNASILGVYLHGLAGDICAGQTGQRSLIASDIIENLGKAYLTINSIK